MNNNINQYPYYPYNSEYYTGSPSTYNTNSQEPYESVYNSPYYNPYYSYDYPAPRPGFYWAIGGYTYEITPSRSWNYYPYYIETPIPPPIYPQHNFNVLPVNASSQSTNLSAHLTTQKPEQISQTAEKVAQTGKKALQTLPPKATENDTVEEADESDDDLDGDYGATATATIDPAEQLNANTQEIALLTSNIQAIEQPIETVNATCLTAQTLHQHALDEYHNFWVPERNLVYPAHNLRDQYWIDDLETASREGWETHVMHYFPLDFLKNIEDFEHFKLKNFNEQENVNFYIPCRITPLANKKLSEKQGLIEIAFIRDEKLKRWGKPSHMFINRNPKDKTISKYFRKQQQKFDIYLTNHSDKIAKFNNQQIEILILKKG